MNPPSGPNGSAAKKAAAPAPAAEVEVLDLGVLEEMGIVPGSGPGSVAASIITIFLREERPRVEKLPGLAAERNGPDLAQAAHNVAGSCAILGARQVQAAAIALELATRADNWPAVAAQVAVLQGAWIRLEAALAQYREP